MQEKPQRDEHEAAGQEDEQPILRIVDAEHLHDAAQRLGHRHREGVAAPDHQRHVVEDERDAEREQHLAQLVAAHEAQQPFGEHEPGDRDGDDRRHAAEDEAAAPHRHGEADIAAEQVERAVGEIDDAQQAENQRESARHHEQQRRERQSVEKLQHAHVRSPRAGRG